MSDLLNNPTFWGPLLVAIVTIYGLLAKRHGDSATTIQIQGKTLADAFNEIEDLRKQIKNSDRRNTITWGYMIALVEGYKKHNIIPPDPPIELQTDPELMRLIKSIQASTDKKQVTQ